MMRFIHLEVGDTFRLAPSEKTLGHSRTAEMMKVNPKSPGPCPNTVYLDGPARGDLIFLTNSTEVNLQEKSNRSIPNYHRPLRTRREAAQTETSDKATHPPMKFNALKPGDQFRALYDTQPDLAHTRLVLDPTTLNLLGPPHVNTVYLEGPHIGKLDVISPNADVTLIKAAANVPVGHITFGDLEPGQIFLVPGLQDRGFCMKMYAPGRTEVSIPDVICLTGSMQGESYVMEDETPVSPLDSIVKLRTKPPSLTE